MSETHVELAGISKRYGGVRALTDVDLTIRRGSIHALAGENGAGKSTLGKIIEGVVRPDGGTMNVLGRPVSYQSPRQALRDGTTMIAQEISLVPERTVIENVFLGSETSRLGIVSKRALRRRYDALIEQAGFDLPPDTEVGTLRLALQQQVEILRALARNVRLIVMDEPTAALSATEAEKLFEIVRHLNANGVTVIYVSHFLKEMLELADTVTVLRDGKVVRTSPTEGETPESLVTSMLGRSLELTFPDPVRPPAGARTVLEVEHLSRGRAVRDVSFSIREGEILGLAGLVGSGRSETARLVFGADRADAGTIRLNGRELDTRSARAAVRHGIAMLPESRKTQGLVLGRSVLENVTLPHLRHVSRGSLVSLRDERRRTAALLERVGVDGSRLRSDVSALSGGNQQKVVFAKWLFQSPTVLIADEPTRGVDVGAKRAIYELLTSLAADGMSVLVISSDLEEVIGLAHRILVMRNGGVVGEFDGNATEETLMAAAFGMSAAAA
jgi:simple sugar transport system ATP-binding protein/ribose transport system ATP-binding protein